MPDIFVDADGCPVKEEVYRVANRYGFKVILVANAWMRVPAEDWLEMVVVDGQLDSTDDWIVEHVTQDDIVISGDIPLASRRLEKGVLVLGPRGRIFTDDTIGKALAKRELLSHLRDLGTMRGGAGSFRERRSLPFSPASRRDHPDRPPEEVRGVGSRRASPRKGSFPPAGGGVCETGG